MYEVRLVYPPEFPRGSIEDCVNKFCGLIFWQPKPDPKPQLFKSILQAEGSPSLGFVHHYTQLSVLSSEYSLSIYPPQLRRAVGKSLDSYWKFCGDFDWNLIDQTRLKKVHEIIFFFVTTIKLESPLLCASICPEVWGHLEPLECGRSICISRNLAVHLNLPASSVDKMPEYVAIDL